jgi:Putative motility protein
MDITSIASQATAMQGENMGLQIGTAVMKKIQDQEKQQGAALIQMIQQTASAVSASGHVDVYA